MAAAGNKNMEVFLPAQTVSGCADVAAVVGIRSARRRMRAGKHSRFLCYLLSTLKESRFNNSAPQKFSLTKSDKAFIMRAVLVKWLIRQADIAHLVERNLAKVEVASSSLVVRSKRK